MSKAIIIFQTLSKLLIPLIVVMILGIGILLLNGHDYNWDDWKPATCMTTEVGCFCENIQDTFVRQPINAISSLSFVFVGIIAILGFGDIPDRSKAPIANLSYRILFASALIVVGMGSAFYHISLSFVGQSIDVAGMYLVINFILIYAFSRMAKISRRFAMAIYFFITGVLIIVILFFPEFRRYIFALLTVTAIALEVAYQRKSDTLLSRRYLVAAVFILAFAFLIWLADTYKVFCQPNSLIQGHAIWHILGAISSLLVFKYYYSERSKPVGSYNREK